MMMIIVISMLSLICFFSIPVHTFLTLVNDRLPPIPLIWIEMTEDNSGLVQTYKVLSNGKDFGFGVQSGVICAAAHAKILFNDDNATPPFTKLLLLYDHNIHQRHTTLTLSPDGMTFVDELGHSSWKRWNPQQFFWPQHTASECLQSFFTVLNDHAHRIAHMDPHSPHATKDVYLLNDMETQITGFCLGLVNQVVQAVNVEKNETFILKPSGREDECYACNLNVMMMTGEERSLILFVYAPLETYLTFVVASKLTPQALLYSTRRTENTPPEDKTYTTEMKWGNLPHHDGLMIYPPPHNLFTKGAKTLLHKIIAHAKCCDKKKLDDLTQQLEHLLHQHKSKSIEEKHKMGPDSSSLDGLRTMELHELEIQQEQIKAQIDKIHITITHVEQLLLSMRTNIMSCIGNDVEYEIRKVLEKHIDDVESTLIFRKKQVEDLQAIMDATTDKEKLEKLRNGLWNVEHEVLDIFEKQLESYKMQLKCSLS